MGRPHAETLIQPTHGQGRTSTPDGPCFAQFCADGQENRGRSNANPRSCRHRARANRGISGRAVSRRSVRSSEPAKRWWSGVWLSVCDNHRVPSANDDLEAVARVLGGPVTFVARLTGGQHAVTTVVSDGHDEYVVRRFPPGDDAVSREVRVLPKVAALGAIVPRLIAFDLAVSGPVIVTSRVAGTSPDPGLVPTALSLSLARVLARIHQLDGTGLPSGPAALPTGESLLAVRARQDWPLLERAPRVLTHSDFWSGNALWNGDLVTGVVDWCGARNAPRGLDVAWCRLDLVLLGSHAAADAFLAEYEAASGTPMRARAAWDRYAAARADPIVESWAVNYDGIGRSQITSEVLRRRFDLWADHRLTEE